MAVYIVTGKLGAGKTLLCILKILAYLKSRRPVAVNLDIKLDKFCNQNNKYSRVVRLPDLPTAEDLMGLGFGCDSYDEDKFGGIFLDEAGVWLNSRDWNAKGRTDLLSFFLFLRKRRWDLWLCVQNINVIDKQIRESIAEHVVYINRADKLRLPFPFGLILRAITLGRFKGKLPKFHLATVKLGCKHNAPQVDSWYYRGEEFYSFYDTTQEYNKGYDHGAYSMLPPGYWRRPLPAAKRGLSFKMRLTKIFFKRTRIINAFFLGSLLSLVVSGVLFSGIAYNASGSSDSTVSQSSELVNNLRQFEGYKIVSYVYANGVSHYVLKSPDLKRVTSSDIVSMGYSVTPYNSSTLIVSLGDQSLTVTR